MKRAIFFTALLLAFPALAVSAPIPPQPVTIDGDGVILTPQGMTMELGPGDSATVTPEGLLITGTVMLKGGSVLVAPVRPVKAAR